MTRTEGERLARIEAILEENLVRRLDDMGGDIRAIRDDMRKHKVETDADKADLAQLKNRGLGLLIGVGLAGGAAGAGLIKFWQSLFG